MIIIGIDPGASGGIAMLDTWNGDGKLFACDLVPMPETERDIFDTVDRKGEAIYPIAYVEWIHPAIQGIGKSAMAKLYGNYMACRMAVIAAGIRMEIVKPQEWQKGLGIPKRAKAENTTKWKNRLKAKAQQLFPSVDVTLKTADALLIAEYGRRKEQGQ